MKAKEVKRIKVRVELVRDGADNKIIAHFIEVNDEFDRSKKYILDAIKMLADSAIDLIDGDIDD